MSSSDVLGQFLWHELLTSDPEAGAGFYPQVFGWDARPHGSEQGYTVLGGKHGPVGGARVTDSDPLAAAVGPNWLTYVGVRDLGAALAAAEAHGGRVLHPPQPLPDDGGRYAVISDPQGGALGLYEPAPRQSDPRSAAAAAGPVGWHELVVPDAAAALEFYNRLFGWEVVGEVPMGGDVGTYYLFGFGDQQLGGAFNRPSHLPPSWPRWLVYVAVPSVKAAVAAAEAAGGQLLNGPHQVPGGNWVAQVVDSHGVPLALHGPLEAGAPQPATPPAKRKAAAPAAGAKATASRAKATKAKATKAKATKAKKPKAAAPKSGTSATTRRKVKPKRKSKSKPVVKARRGKPKAVVRAKRTGVKAKKPTPRSRRKAPRRAK